SICHCQGLVQTTELRKQLRFSEVQDIQLLSRSAVDVSVRRIGPHQLLQQGLRMTKTCECRVSIAQALALDGADATISGAQFELKLRVVLRLRPQLLQVIQRFLDD